MSGAFVVGNRLVSIEELDEKVALGEISRYRDMTERGKPAEIRLMSGTVTSAELAAEAERPEFTSIGIGKPLAIEILTIYTGDAPNRFLAFLLGDPGLLVTSGARGVQTATPPPRAINQLVQSVGDREYLQPDAFAKGSPVVYYSPAMINPTTLTSYELVVDSFDAKVFESLSQMFAAAGGLPVFAPASVYLLAGSMLMKMFTKLGKSLLESDPFLRSRFNIRFDTPALEVTQARHIVLYNARDENEFSSHVALPVKHAVGQEQIRLVNEATKNEYKGLAPYIVVSLNGKPRNDLDKFASTHASAELLEDFYRAESSANSVEVLQSALELYNDLTFREKAERLTACINDLPEGSVERAEAEGLLKAYKDNIRHAVFKLA